MNTDLAAELESEKEFLELLKRTCRTTRQSRTRPDLAIPAGQWEIKINNRLDEISAQTQTLAAKQPKAMAA